MIKLTYVSHACLMMEGNTQTGIVVTDPWYNGPAYLNQWHVFPKPVDTSLVEKAEHIILTHGHEDHLHIPTLLLLNKAAVVYFPFTWKDGTRELLESIGFTNIHEVPSFEKVKISDELSFTFIVNGLDAFAVYEYEGKVIINLNDALNASHWSFVEIFAKIIRKRWEKVDLLICGLGGASYFPNTVHASNKDDKEIALLREQFLAHKCCEIMEEINPDKIMSFVPGFALLEHDKQWINSMRFPRSLLADYYKEHFNPNNTIEFFNPMPGDYIENSIWYKSSPYHEQAKNDSLSHLVKEQYSKEIAYANTYDQQSSEIIYELEQRLKMVLKTSNTGIAKELLQQVNFTVECKDISENIYIHIYYQSGKIVSNVVKHKPDNINLSIKTHSWKLAYAIDELWGGDVFYIGYGADIYILNENCLKDNLDIVSLRLLSRFPSASFTMKREPLRALKYLSGNPQFAYLAIQQKLLTRGNPNKLPYNERAHWVNKSKCDVCRLCDIPLLSDDFGEILATKSTSVN